jgi:hypothetical protein
MVVLRINITFDIVSSPAINLHVPAALISKSAIQVSPAPASSSHRQPHLSQCHTKTFRTMLLLKCGPSPSPGRRRTTANRSGATPTSSHSTTPAGPGCTPRRSGSQHRTASRRRRHGIPLRPLEDHLRTRADRARLASAVVSTLAALATLKLATAAAAAAAAAWAFWHEWLTGPRKGRVRSRQREARRRCRSRGGGRGGRDRWHVGD